jgi:heme/copper-type cytochrome/quinol oxidase subunit 2
MMNPRLRRAARCIILLLPALAGALLLIRAVAVAQDQGPIARPFSVTARRYAFEPARIEVLQDDVVRIELRSDDIAHSWTVDAYRIAKRVSPGQPVTFEFRADKIGTFPFYCNLQTEDGCRQMRGQLIVKPRR